ncbi:uncharacterized protein LOC143588946 [Bidens hawaiensis]|uniref:uncharacterized protein LOC143588946 n=1 Tax=Bidens hawaiensis TaxID=980011 RepID=UPI00404A3B53
MDNAGEFTSQTFNDYCMSIGISVEHPVAHVHTQNGLAESLIKRLQLIAKPLLMRCKLPSSAWGHAILHAASLIRLRPTADHEYSPLQLVSGREPSLSHIKLFGCAIYVPIPPPQCTKMGPQRRLGIYVGFNSQTISKYLEPLIGDLFAAHFADCQFNETVFPVLGGDKNKERLVIQDITWNASSLSNLDPRSGQCEYEVQKIIHLQRIENELPDAFTDTNRVTKSHIPASNAPARIEVIPEAIAIQRKRGRPIGSKDKNPRKRKEQNNVAGESLEKAINETLAEVNVLGETNMIPEENEISEETLIPNEDEISINYVQDSTMWNRNETHVDDVFAYAIATDVINENDYIPKILEECMHRKDWPRWEEAIKAELNSLEKRHVFGPVVRTPIDVKPVEKTAELLKKKFEMKDLGTPKLCLSLQFEHLRNGTFVHQSNYIQKMLVRFNMDKAHPFSTPMVVR